MADFALWVAAASPALGFTADEFLTAYNGNRAGANETALEVSVLAGTLIAYAAATSLEKGEWEGRAADLLALLVSYADEATRKQRGWPVDAARLSAELKTHRSRSPGIRVSVEWRKARIIRLEIGAALPMKKKAVRQRYHRYRRYTMPRKAVISQAKRPYRLPVANANNAHYASERYGCQYGVKAQR